MVMLPSFLFRCEWSIAGVERVLRVMFHSLNVARLKIKDHVILLISYQSLCKKANVAF